mmetsp:Transcript_20361/g.37783  ORF Transcript_20361/g.37783 Transcript_20361/m.37783 type:complete len:638 (+) Transcript_20361:110-2023(+)|eukprot:CAMPEP_0114415984 /NCGR_PEP_ID=MMETSP0103-20121206/2197_1 /TAXON_ID=37642 ORGANISM="Paraphysomonas imperforata, Strain PA2" /NCGR_SAMPLE_ID=MMETSP0103 /ASSEMBLY_ACC=CAM_ASM_000201 /LENGTH=637 /DNA_ID=CAMNT_0001584197 /DNA_START=50 /DNA_END=1963 /DNA_ORIENTATION=-
MLHVLNSCEFTCGAKNGHETLRNLKVPVADNEWHRLAVLLESQLLDSATTDENFNRYTSMCARHFKVPIALVSLVDIDRQWFKSKVGLDAAETHRDISFCTYTVLPESPDVFVVLDANKDPRFAGTALVAGPPHVIFYAGAALWVDGQKLGSLCIIDNVPHDSFSLADQQNLMDIATGVSQLISARRAQFLRCRKRQSQQVLSLKHNLRTPCMSLEFSVKSLVANMKDAQASRSARDLQAQTDHLMRLVRLLTDLCSFMPSMTCSESSENGTDKGLCANGYPCQLTSVIGKMEAILQLICANVELHMTVDSSLQSSHTSFVSFPEVFSIVALDLIGSCVALSRRFEVNVFFRNNTDASPVEGAGPGRVVLDLVVHDYKAPCEVGKDRAHQALLRHSELLHGVGGGWSVEPRGGSVNIRYWLPLKIDATSELIRRALSDDDAQQRPRALVLENDSSMQEQLVGILEQEGCEVQARSNGAQGLLALAEATEHRQCFDFIFVSLLMPIMHGGSFVSHASQWLQQRDLRDGEGGEGGSEEHPCVIGMLGATDRIVDFLPPENSDNMNSDDVRCCEVLGLAQAIRKPLDALEVRALVEARLHARRRRRASEPTVAGTPVKKKNRLSNWLGLRLGDAKISPTD